MLVHFNQSSIIIAYLSFNFIFMSTFILLLLVDFVYVVVIDSLVYDRSVGKVSLEILSAIFPTFSPPVDFFHSRVEGRNMWVGDMCLKEVIL